MLKRLGKTITNNFSLKILAVILAVVLWVVVINIRPDDVKDLYLQCCSGEYGLYHIAEQIL